MYKNNQNSQKPKNYRPPSQDSHPSYTNQNSNAQNLYQAYQSPYNNNAVQHPSQSSNNPYLGNQSPYPSQSPYQVNKTSDTSNQDPLSQSFNTRYPYQPSQNFRPPSQGSRPQENSSTQKPYQVNKPPYISNQTPLPQNSDPRYPSQPSQNSNTQHPFQGNQQPDHRPKDSHQKQGWRSQQNNNSMPQQNNSNLPSQNNPPPQQQKSPSFHQRNSSLPQQNRPPQSCQQKKTPSCHLYQTNECKFGNKCHYFHSGKPAGACVEPECHLCDMKNELQYCNTTNCLCKKQHLHNQGVNQKIASAIEALNDQINIINKCKYELQDLINTESETKDAMATKLKQLLEQRADFIKVVNTKISKFLAKPDDIFNLASVAIEAKLFARGLPAYSVCKKVKYELYQTDKKFCSVLGETGSGKTTQVPQYLYQEIKHTNKKILCVQPRKIAAMSLATRVAWELGVTLGEEVGYQVGPGKPPKEGDTETQYTESKFSNNTRILFMTESVLLKRLIVACKAPPEKKMKFFGSVQAILLDEVHERSLLSDLIFGILKTSLFSKIKIFLASATVNINLFKQYFDDCRTIEIPGRTFPVQIKYKPMFEDNYIQGTVEVIKEVVSQKRRGNTDYQGHVLVFLTGLEEMEEIQNKLKIIFRGTSFEEDYQVCFLHGKLDNDEQQKIFDTSDSRIKVILATKIAESSITINGVRIVIDSGYDKDSYYDSQKGINVLELDWISQASAKQRMGRAGRTAPGICFRLYSEDTFQRFELHKKPEISKINLESAMLKIMDSGMDPQTFPFLEPPEKQVIDTTMTALRFLEALDGQNRLTSIGKIMMEMSTEPKKTKAIVKAAQLGCLNEVLQVIAMESYAGSIYFLPKDKKEREEALNRRISYEGYQSDHLDYLQTFQSWQRIKYQERNSWCKERFIKGSIMNKVNKTYTDLQKEIYKLRKKNPEIAQLLPEIQSNGSVADNILKSLFASSIISLAKFSGIRPVGYVNVLNGALFHIHVSSGQHHYFPQVNDTEKEFAIYSKMENLNGLNKAKFVSFIKSDWLKDRSLISKEMLEKINAGAQENYQFKTRTIELPSWSIKLFKKLFKHRINDWMGSKKGQSIQMIQPNDTTICFVHSNNLSKEVESLYATLKKELDENVFSDNLIYNMENTNYTPIVRAGLGVSEILLTGEYITLSYQVHGKKNKGQILSLLGLRENEIHYITVNEDLQKTAGNIRFFKKKDAERFYANFKRKEEVKLEPVVPYNKKVQMFDSCKIKATFCLANSLRRAHIVFENSLDSEQVMERLRNSPSVDGAQIKTHPDPKNPYAFYLSDLSPYTDEEVLKNYVMGPLSLPKISVERETINPSLMKEMLEGEARMIFNSIFTQFLSREEIQNMYFIFKNSRKHQNLTHALITMPSKAIAVKIMEKYNGEKDVFGTQRLRIKIKNSLTLKIHQNIFHVLSPIILSKIEELKRAQPHVKIQTENPHKSAQEYKIKIAGEDNNVNRVIAAKIEALTRGEHFSISSQGEKMALFGSIMLGQYPKIQQSLNRRPNSCYIQADPKTKKLIIYSLAPEIREEAKKRIQEELKKLKTVEFIDLKNYNIKKVKAFIDKNNRDFPTLHDNTFDLNLDYRAKKVFVKADKNFIETLKRNIEPFLVPEKNQDKEACPICFESLPDDCCILYKCGHKFCRDDFKNCLESQEYNTHLKCPLPNCQETLTLMDIQSVLSVDSLNSIIEDHVRTFVGTQHQFYRNCPTADCCHLFKVGERSYHCQSCFENYCTLDLNDLHQAHPDLSCAQFKSSNKADEKFQELIEKGEVKMTRCCNIPMMKSEGCNHMTCTQCKGHFCWLCLEVFPSGNQTYQHLRVKHGGLH